MQPYVIAISRNGPREVSFSPHKRFYTKNNRFTLLPTKYLFATAQFRRRKVNALTKLQCGVAA